MILLEWIKFWFGAEFFAIGVSSFLGVYVRIAISKRFPLETLAYGCDMASLQQNPFETDPFLHLYLSRQVLIPNIVGCFLMAFFISFAQPLSNISVSFFKSLTTGLCGCITTFSSWVNYTVDDLLNQRWIVVFASLMLEFWVLWAAFTMGFAFSKLLQTSIKDILCYYEKVSSKLETEGIRMSDLEPLLENPEPYDDEQYQRQGIINHKPFAGGEWQQEEGGLERKSFGDRESVSALLELQMGRTTPQPVLDSAPPRQLTPPPPPSTLLHLQPPPSPLRSSRHARSPFKSEHSASGHGLHSARSAGRFDALFTSSFDDLEEDKDNDGLKSKNAMDEHKSSSSSLTSQKAQQQKNHKRKLLSAALAGSVPSAPLSLGVGTSKIVKLHHISGVIDVWREDGAADDGGDRSGSGMNRGTKRQRRLSDAAGMNKTYTVVADGLENKAVDDVTGGSGGGGDLEEGLALVKKPTILSRTSTVMTLEKASDNNKNQNSCLQCFRQLATFPSDVLLPYFQENETWIWAVAFVVTASAVWISIAVFDSNPDTTHRQPVPISDQKLVWLRSIALGPLGAWFRWGLTRVRSIKNCWPEVNPQTLAANQVAVALACLLQVLASSWSWTLPVIFGESRLSSKCCFA